MASAAQIAANRRNALKSTGPRTAAGKAVSSRNRLRHGLRARAPAMAGEDHANFERFRADLRAELAPRDAREALLAEVVAEGLWRHRRAAQAEAALMNRAGTLALTHAQLAELLLILRYEVAASRAFHCALALLERGREKARPSLERQR
jgi:hypothetical protein